MILTNTFSCKKGSFLLPRDEPQPALLSVSNVLTREVPKFSAADIIAVDSGKLMAVFSNDFVVGDRKSVYCAYSYDGGMTWTEPKKLTPKNAGYELLNFNVLKVNKRIVVIVQRKQHGVGAGEGAIPVFSYSDDNGQTWSKLKLMLSCKEKEFVIINARNFTTTRTRRLIIPVAHGVLQNTVGVVYSDNNGLSWREGPSVFGGDDPHASKFAEPSIAQLNDGRLIMLIRTALGYIYRSYSSDDGITWSKPVATTLQSPWTAHALKVTPEGDLLVVYSRGYSTSLGWPRNNLTFAFSSDNGETWKDSRVIIDHTDPQYFVMQPSILLLGDKILISYLHMSPVPDRFTDNSIRTAIFKKSDIIK